MEARLREERLNELRQREEYAWKEMTYKNRTEKMPVYEIPVDCLVFNQYNGRIGTFVKTYEQQYSPIDSSTTEGMQRQQIQAGELYQQQMTAQEGLQARQEIDLCLII